MSAPRILVFGFGYSAAAFARAMRGRAEWIAGTVRSRDKAESLAAEGVRGLVFDGVTASADVSAAITRATHIVVSIPPGDADEPVLASFGEAIAAAKPAWIGYLSTVGVYGSYGGAWVCEATTPHPVSDRAVRRLAAEKAWAVLGARAGVPVAVFRIAGIYGPSRNTFVQLAEGSARRIVKPGQVFNRIHVDDLAAGLVAALDRGTAGVVNLADDEPAPPEDVIAFAAETMGVPVPPAIPFAEAELTPMQRSFYGECKRVLNRRLREELGVTLRYPTWREGLSALWRDGWR